NRSQIAVAKSRFEVNRLHLDRLAGLHSSDEIDTRTEGVLQVHDAISRAAERLSATAAHTHGGAWVPATCTGARAAHLTRGVHRSSHSARLSDVIERWTRLDQRVVPLVERAARQIEGGADDATRLDACSVLLSQLATTLPYPPR